MNNSVKGEKALHKEESLTHNSFRCIWRCVNFAFAMYKSFYFEKKCYHTCEENKIKVLSHQNCPTTIQSRVFMVNIIFTKIIFTSFTREQHLFYFRENWLNQMDSRSLQPVSARSKIQENSSPFHSLKVQQLFSPSYDIRQLFFSPFISLSQWVKGKLHIVVL